MRLFPHQVVETKSSESFGNIIDDETAICCSCGETIPFISEEADQIPEDYSSNSEYTFVSMADLKSKNIKFKLNIDPIIKEEWRPQDKKEYNQQLVQKLRKIADEVKNIGNSFYSELFEKPFRIEPKFTIDRFDTNPLYIESEEIDLASSKIEITTEGDISILKPENIISWTLKDGREIGSRLLDYNNHYKLSPVRYKINYALYEEFQNRFLDLLKRNNFQQTLREFYSIYPVISKSLNFYVVVLMRRLYNLIENNDNDGNYFFDQNNSRLFFDVSDSLNSLSNIYLQEDFDISTNFNVLRDSGKKDIPNLFLPVCEDCAEDMMARCNDCNRYKFEADMSKVDGNFVCERCSEHYVTCEDCGVMIFNEDAEYDEDSGSIFCRDCFKKSVSVDTDEFDEPYDASSAELFFLSGNKQTLDKLLVGLNTFKNKVNGGPKEKIKRDIVNVFKANGIKEDEANIILNTLSTASTVSINPSFEGEFISDSSAKLFIDECIKSINNYLSHQDSFYSKYPLAIDANTRTQNIFSGKKIELLKSYQPMPVTYEYDAAHRGSDNFVIKMMPSETLLAQAESLFPGIGRKSWEYFSKAGTQHHPGCIAYARISYDGESLVIDNLQRDADLNNANVDSYKARYRDPAEQEMAEKALRWWDKRTSKWYVQFTDYLINFANNNSKKLYLTNFETQKRKWYSIPQKNMEVYDNLPEELSSAAFYKKLMELKQENPNETEESLKEKIKNGEVSIYPRYDETPNRRLKIEGVSAPVGGIWRLAKKHKILNIFKYSKKI